MDAFITSTLLVALAEIGDKTQLLSFVLAARLRKPGAIIAGIFVATVANHALAGSVGVWLASLVSPHWLPWVTGLLFIGFGLWTLHPDSLDDDPKLHRAGAFVTTLIAFFLAEMGDKTQLAAVNLSASTKQPLSVFLGGTAALAAVTGLGVLFGEGIMRLVPEIYIRRGAAALFVGIGVFMWFKHD